MPATGWPGGLRPSVTPAVSGARLHHRPGAETRGVPVGCRPVVRDTPRTRRPSRARGPRPTRIPAPGRARRSAQDDQEEGRPGARAGTLRRLTNRLVHEAFRGNIAIAEIVYPLKGLKLRVCPPPPRRGSPHDGHHRPAETAAPTRVSSRVSSASSCHPERRSRRLPRTRVAADGAGRHRHHRRRQLWFQSTEVGRQVTLDDAVRQRRVVRDEGERRDVRGDAQGHHGAVAGADGRFGRRDARHPADHLGDRSRASCSWCSGRSRAGRAPSSRSTRSSSTRRW